MLPKISIIIPSFNKADYIGETLESIVTQGYPNFEVIIQDGGSTDKTLGIIKKFANKYPKLIRWESKKDKGQTDAINKGLKKAKGEILTYINADDVYEKDALNSVGKHFSENPGVSWLAGKGRVIDKKGCEITKWVTAYKNLLLTLNNYQLLLIVNYLMQPSVFFSREAYEKHGPFTGEGFVMEYDLWLKMGKEKMPVVINIFLSRFRMGGENISSVLFNKQLKMDEEIVKRYTNNPFLIFLHKLNNVGRVATVNALNKKAANWFLIGFLAVTYLLLFIDTLKYPGFIAKHFFIDAKVYLAGAVTILIFFKGTLSKGLLKVNTLVLVFTALLYLYLAGLEASNYANYVLAAYHLSLEGLIFVPLFGLMIAVSQRPEIKSLAEKISHTKYFTIFLFLIIFTLTVNIGRSLKVASVANLYVLLHPRDSYDEKMFFQWKDFYNYMLFVKNNTPEDATIIIPPQIAPWWTRSGNLGLTRSFLYPRNVLQYPTIDLPDPLFLPDRSFILVAWGEWGCENEETCRGWPVQQVAAKEFRVKLENSFEIKDIKTDYLYDPADTSNPFGLLKI